MRYIKQRDRSDCGIACAAMLTGQPYRAVLRVYEEMTGQKPDWHKSGWGMDAWRMDELLWRFGLCVTRHWLFDSCPPWDGKPLSDRMLFHVAMDFGNHFVVGNDKCRIYDPANARRKRVNGLILLAVCGVYQAWK